MINSTVQDFLLECKDLDLTEKEKLNILYEYLTSHKVSKIDRKILHKYEGLELHELLYNRGIYLSEDEKRSGGDFYTPKIWVKEGHKYLKKNLGENFEDEYIVWDLCCGTGNLTRGLGMFKFLSTLSEEDLGAALIGNLKSYSFQYDFLNDDIEEGLGVWGTEVSSIEALKNTKLYQSYGGKQLLRLLQTGYWSALEEVKCNKCEKKKLLILINPPYVAAGNMKEKDKAKVGVSNTKLKDKIHISGIGENLYSQFFYRILCFIRQFSCCEIVIASYTSLTLWSGPKFDGLRLEYEKLGYGIVDGFVFSGSEFTGCSSKWACSFTILQEYIGSLKEFRLDIKGIKNDKIECIKNGECFYSLDEKDRLTTWVKEKIDNRKSYDAPQLSNALALSKGKGRGLGNIVDDTLGYMVFTNNCVAKCNEIFGLSSCANMGHGFNITQNNFDRAIVGFMARRLIVREFYNERKEFMKPLTDRAEFREFLLDSYVACVFNSKGLWSSLRSFKYTPQKECKLGKVGCVEYLGKRLYSGLEEDLWNIYNEFFFIEKQEIRNLAIKYKKTEIIEDLDADTREESFMCKKLSIVNKDLSKEALYVLNKAKELVDMTFEYREGLNYPWDSGWYQIKKLIAECGEIKVQENLKIFNSALKELEAKMRPIVYRLEFLK